MLRYFIAFLDYVRQQGIYIYRGDPVEDDFNLAEFTRDDTWHELDLSAIVPEHAKAIDLTLTIQNSDINGYILFRRGGQAGGINTCGHYIPVINRPYRADLVIPIDSDRKIDYIISAGGWAFINFLIKGWWY